MSFDIGVLDQVYHAILFFGHFAKMTASCSAIILSASASWLLLLPVTLTRGVGGGCGCQACCFGAGVRSGMEGTET
jgi:hypothetical protein